MLETATVPAQESQVDTLPPYPLDQKEIEVAIVAGKQKLFHKLLRPTLAQLIERENQTSYQSESISDDEEQIVSDDEGANARLYDQIVTGAKGYLMPGQPRQASEEWRSKDDAWVKLIPSAHKSLAVRSMYRFTCEIERDAIEEEGFLLGETLWTVKQTFGDPDAPAYVVRHHLRTPDEKARREFKGKASRVSFSKGTRKQRTRIATNLKAYVELYDGLYSGIDGVSGSTSLPNIDAIWKRQVVDCLMREFDAQLSD